MVQSKLIQMISLELLPVFTYVLEESDTSWACKVVKIVWQVGNFH